MTRYLRSVPIVLVLLAGCGGQHSVGTTYTKGYLSTDGCTSATTQSACEAKTGCAWIEPKCGGGAPCPPAVCYAPDPCLAISDEKTCEADASCAWSGVKQLCPLGTTCPSGGFCHPRDPSGGPCACVTPVACPPGVPCPPPECDCTGGTGGGGTCTCACPACAPGETCPPCNCDCGPGSPGGCITGGTCTCGCPACPAGTTCPPCTCDCGSGGPVPAPGPTPLPPSTDPCSKYTDQASCTGDTADSCQWFALGVPCMVGQPCTSGVCQSPSTAPPPSSGGTGGGCACGCPGCPPGTTCPPCTCDCGGGSSGGSSGSGGGCVPPPLPSPTPTTCPTLGCGPNCPNGVTTDANGCPTCTCA